MGISNFSHFNLFSSYSRLYSICVSFSTFFSFPPYSWSYKVYFSFFTFFTVSRHIPGHTVFVSHFLCSSVFSPLSRSYRVHVIFFTFFRCSHNIPGPTVCIYHFSSFSLFLNIFQVLKCLFLILPIIQCFSPYSISYHVCVSFFMFFSFLAIFHATVYISHFSCIPVFLAKFQVLLYEFLIFFVGQIYRHILVLQREFLILQVFQCFSPYYRSYSVCVSFSRFFSFLTTFQVLQYVCLIFLVCQFIRHIPGATVGVSQFAHLSDFLAIFHVLPCNFIIFLFCLFSRHIPGTTLCV